MNRCTYTCRSLSASSGSRRGWSLILLLFISASFIAVLPAIMSHLDTSAKSSTAFERWTQLQRAEDMMHIVAADGPKTINVPFGLNQTFSIMLTPEKLPEVGFNVWEMKVSSTVNGVDSGFAESKFIVKLPGNGSAEYPFAVATVEDLELLRENTDENTHFVIAANIELPSDPDYSWKPIGTPAKPFKGIVKTFQDENGEYFTISGMRITPDTTGDRLFGMFGAVSGARIENVHLKDVRVDTRTVSNSSTGALIGLAENGTQIVGCYASGEVRGENNTGGLVGRSINSSIIQCRTDINVGVEMPTLPSSDYTPVVSPAIGEVFAALSGSGLPGAVRASIRAASVAVSSPAVMGNAVIRASVIPASNTPNGENVGGLVGYTNGTVTGSTATGNVSGIRQIGGLIGYAATGASISKSMATGQVTASKQNSGGLIGLADGAAVTACVAKGTVSGAFQNSGGLVGKAMNGSITDSIARGNVEGEVTYLGGLCGYNLSNTITNSFATGNVTAIGYYYVAGGLIGESADSDISKSFASGNVSAFVITGGLIGSLLSGNVTTSYATGEATSESLSGGLIGYVISGTVSSCYATGAVTGTGTAKEIGGLVGGNRGTISASYAHGAVSGVLNIGGLVGQNSTTGTLTHCYSIGFVTGTSNTGGLIGLNDNAGGITYCYWNTDTSGQAASAGGEGRTTYQLLNGTRNARIGTDYVFRAWANADWHFNPITEYPRLKKAYNLIMAEVPGGTYQRDANTGNLSTVTGFKMGTQEVTQQQYMAITGLSNPSYTVNPQFPVQGINWYAAIAFCNRLSILEGLTPAYKISRSTNPDSWGAIPTVQTTAWDSVTCNWTASGYRLATEDEYQWASMGAQNNYLKAFSGSNGSNSIDDYAWYLTNTGSNIQQSSVLLPNELGLYDMSGNMWDIVWDRAATPANGARTDYRGPTTGTDRIVRGGDFTRDATWQTVTSSIRYLPPAGIYSNVGFRIVKKL